MWTSWSYLVRGSAKWQRRSRTRTIGTLSLTDYIEVAISGNHTMGGYNPNRVSRPASSPSALGCLKNLALLTLFVSTLLSESRQLARPKRTSLVSQASRMALELRLLCYPTEDERQQELRVLTKVMEHTFTTFAYDGAFDAFALVDRGVG
ncbi:hypothetical protein PYCCODRAFT_1249157 [Trametes coccinea BRFM310]|uniref:Uncharacterized protein n=1 Tax=Trametes coccinea (strain BRFM310) TaxID=1353009 RepID=A0A1Y2I8U7_TRAC3|nr:hypothetical protein PYCCODRAFT_1249157 [Trametes coccinea BRFM310]